MLLSKCAISNSQKSKFVKKQEASGLLRIRNTIIQDTIVV